MQFGVYSQQHPTRSLPVFLPEAPKLDIQRRFQSPDRFLQNTTKSSDVINSETITSHELIPPLINLTSQQGAGLNLLPNPVPARPEIGVNMVHLGWCQFIGDPGDIDVVSMCLCTSRVRKGS